MMKILEVIAGLLLLLGLGAQVEPAAFTPWLLLYAVTAVILERSAVPLSGYGFVSAATPLYLGLGPGWGTVALVLGQAARLEVGRDALPVLAAQFLVVAFPELGPAIGFVYLPLALLYPFVQSYWGGRAAQSVLQRWPLFLAMACLGSGIWWLAPPAGCLLLPVLWVLPLQGSAPLEEVENLRLEKLRLREQLQELEEFAYHIHSLDTVQQIADQGVRSLVRLSGAASGSLLVPQGAGFEVVVGPEEFEAAWITQTLKSGKVAQARSSNHFRLALPWENEAVAYLISEQPFQKLELLQRLSRLAATAWRAGHEKEQRVALGRAGDELQAWLALMAKLLQSVQRVGSTLDSEVVLEELLNTVKELVEPETCFLILGQKHQKRWTQVPQSRVREPRLEECVEEVIRRGPQRWTAELPVSGQKVAVGLPLAQGVMLLTSSEPRAFPDASRHFLTVLADLATIFLAKADLYQRLEQSQADLAQAGKMAAVGQLAAGVAHEINNPLMAIRVHLDLIRYSLEDEEDVEAADTIGEAVTRCQTIVSELLSFSRKPQSPPAPVKVRELVAEVRRLGSVEFEEAIEGDPRVVGHRHELSQILSNLLNNARYAAGKEGRVELKAGLKNGTVLIQVKDNGDGIPPECRERVFEPFFTTKPVGSGTGLGLYLAYTHARAAGGHLSFETESGRGTVFSLELPQP